MPSDIGFASHLATRGGAFSRTGIPATASPSSDDERPHSRAWMREMERAQIDTWFLAPLPDRKVDTKPTAELADFTVENDPPPLLLPRVNAHDSDKVLKDLRVAYLPAHDRAELTDVLSGAINDHVAQRNDQEIVGDRASGTHDLSAFSREPLTQNGSTSEQSETVNEQLTTPQPLSPRPQSDVQVLAPVDAKDVLAHIGQEKGITSIAGGQAAAQALMWSSEMAPSPLETQHWPAMPRPEAMTAPTMSGTEVQGRLQVSVQNTSALPQKTVTAFHQDYQDVDEQKQEGAAVGNTGKLNSVQSAIDALRSQNDIGIHIEKTPEGHAIWLSVPSDIDDADQHLQYIVRAMTNAFTVRGERIWQVVCNGTKVWSQDRWTEGFHNFSANRARAGLICRTRTDTSPQNPTEEN